MAPGLIAHILAGQGEGGLAGPRGEPGPKGHTVSLKVRSCISVVLFLYLLPALIDSAGTVKGDRGEPGLSGEPGTPGPKVRLLYNGSRSADFSLHFIGSCCSGDSAVVYIQKQIEQDAHFVTTGVCWYLYPALNGQRQGTYPGQVTSPS